MFKPFLGAGGGTRPTVTTRLTGNWETFQKVQESDTGGVDGDVRGAASDVLQSAGSGHEGTVNDALSVRLLQHARKPL